MPGLLQTNADYQRLARENQELRDRLMQVEPRHAGPKRPSSKEMNFDEKLNVLDKMINTEEIKGEFGDRAGDVF